MKYNPVAPSPNLPAPNHQPFSYEPAAWSLFAGTIISTVGVTLGAAAIVSGALPALVIVGFGILAAFGGLIFTVSAIFLGAFAIANNCSNTSAVEEPSPLKDEHLHPKEPPSSNQKEEEERLQKEKEERLQVLEQNLENVRKLIVINQNLSMEAREELEQKKLEQEKKRKENRFIEGLDLKGLPTQNTKLTQKNRSVEALTLEGSPAQAGLPSLQSEY